MKEFYIRKYIVLLYCIVYNSSGSLSEGPVAKEL